VPKQIEGMPLSFKRRTAANHALLKTGFSRSPPVHRTNPEGQLRVDLTRSRSRRGLTGICAFLPYRDRTANALFWVDTGSSLCALPSQIGQFRVNSRRLRPRNHFHERLRSR